MATEKAKSDRYPTAMEMPFQHFGKAEWMKSFAETPTRLFSELYRQSLSATARQLKDQADYVRKLSECSGPEDSLACHETFVRNSLSNYLNDSRKAFDAVYRNVSLENPDR